MLQMAPHKAVAKAAFPGIASVMQSRDTCAWEAQETSVYNAAALPSRHLAL